MDRPAVSIRTCPGYDHPRVREALRLCLGDLGGIGAFVKRGETVVLKVNLLRAARPAEAVTTHPSVVLALSREVEAAGGLPLVADSPSGTVGAGRLRRIYEMSGLLELEKRGELRLNRDLSVRRVSNPRGKVLRSVDVLKVVHEADAVITVPKLKTHTLTGITGATKVLFGMIPGLAKAGYHAKLPDLRDFCDMLLDLAVLVGPRLSVLDGIEGMEGEGPSAGEVRRGNVLMASADSFALDTVMAAFMGAVPATIPILEAAQSRALAPASLEGISLLGDPLDRARSGDWRLPSTRVGILERLSDRLPAPFLRRMGNLLVRRPAPDRSLCDGCGECARNCPQKCIRVVNDVPRIEYAKCRSCFCCSETCPRKAMRVKEPLLGR
ncbi:MAG: DUF362 domain-containing protein [Euryarchaeota archaeon]|nr:DUF362 domain-containing protein [Euryarchaeota archaeon]